VTAGPSESVERRVALVTGGGSGIGQAVAVALAAEGDAVVVTGRRADALAETVDLGAGSAGELFAIAADVRDPASVAELFERTRERYGRLDLLFNNAGASAPPVPLDDLDVDDLVTVIETNVLGSFLCTKHAMALMKRQRPGGGRIINNGSISADRPRPNSAPYTATKHAITGLTKSTMLDGRGHGIACGQIDIGNAKTRRTKRMTEGIAQPDGSTRVEPVMDVGDVARAIVYMASLPLDANVPFLTVMATEMPWIGRG
jgi:NAD(P)-dependent dehydrogenase (short-subunit alcohol dehydrogenase family)